MDAVAKLYARVYEDAAKASLQREQNNQQEKLADFGDGDKRDLAGRVFELMITLAKIHLDMMVVLAKEHIGKSDSQEGVRLEVLAEATVEKFHQTIAALYKAMNIDPEDQENDNITILLLRTALLQKLLAYRIPAVREAQDIRTDRSSMLAQLRSRPVVELYGEIASMDAWENDFGVFGSDGDTTTSDEFDVVQRSAREISSVHEKLVSFFKQGLKISDAEINTIKVLDVRALENTAIFTAALDDLQPDVASASEQSMSSRIDRYKKAHLPGMTELHHTLVTEVYVPEANARARKQAADPTPDTTGLGGRKALQQRGYRWCFC